MRNFEGDRVIVTGASSGIGREIARQLAAAGANLVLVARRKDRLEELAAELAPTRRTVVCVAGDVTDADILHQALGAAETQLGGLDILINNAGVNEKARFTQGGPDRLQRFMQVNFLAPARWIYEALPLLRKSRRGVVVNMGSILGHRGLPRQSEYCASKFALRGFSEALRPELAADGIALVLISPGTTESELWRDAQPDGADPWPPQPSTPASVVARRTLRAIQKEKADIIPSFRGWLLVMANRLAPRLVDRWMRKYG